MHTTYKVTPHKTIEANTCYIQEADTVLYQTLVIYGLQLQVAQQPVPF